MTELATKSSFAKAVNLARSRITQLIAEGLPVRPDGRIDVAKGKRWIKAKLDPARREARKPSGRTNGRANGHSVEKTVADLRGTKMQREADLLDLELQQKRGQLVDRVKAEAAIFDRARMERDRWIGWTARTAPTIAAATGADPTQVFTMLDKLVREHLAELAATPLDGLKP